MEWNQREREANWVRREKCFPSLIISFAHVEFRKREISRKRGDIFTRDKMPRMTREWEQYYYYGDIVTFRDQSIVLSSLTKWLCRAGNDFCMERERYFISHHSANSIIIESDAVLLALGKREKKQREMWKSWSFHSWIKMASWVMTFIWVKADSLHQN